MMFTTTTNKFYKAVSCIAVGMTLFIPATSASGTNFNKGDIIAHEVLDDNESRYIKIGYAQTESEVNWVAQYNQMLYGLNVNRFAVWTKQEKILEEFTTTPKTVILTHKKLKWEKVNSWEEADGYLNEAALIRLNQQGTVFSCVRRSNGDYGIVSLEEEGTTRQTLELKVKLKEGASFECISFNEKFMNTIRYHVEKTKSHSAKHGKRRSTRAVRRRSGRKELDLERMQLEKLRAQMRGFEKDYKREQDAQRAIQREILTHEETIRTNQKLSEESEKLIRDSCQRHALEKEKLTKKYEHEKQFIQNAIAWDLHAKDEKIKNLKAELKKLETQRMQIEDRKSSNIQKVEDEFKNTINIHNVKSKKEQDELESRKVKALNTVTRNKEQIQEAKERLGQVKNQVNDLQRQIEEMSQKLETFSEPQISSQANSGESTPNNEADSYSDNEKPDEREPAKFEVNNRVLVFSQSENRWIRGVVTKVVSDHKYPYTVQYLVENDVREKGCSPRHLRKIE